MARCICRIAANQAAKKGDTNEGKREGGAETIEIETGSFSRGREGGGSRRRYDAMLLVGTSWIPGPATGVRGSFSFLRPSA